jgi:hypothetical protein
MGSGGNWDFNQTLNAAGQVEWPQGPLIDFTTDDVKYVEAWVVQRQTGASQRYWDKNLGKGLTTWIARRSGWKTGEFEPGPAVGIALVSWEDTDDTYHFIWWADQINLVPPADDA